MFSRLVREAGGRTVRWESAVAVRPPALSRPEHATSQSSDRLHACRYMDQMARVLARTDCWRQQATSAHNGSIAQTSSWHVLLCEYYTLPSAHCALHLRIPEPPGHTRRVEDVRTSRPRHVGRMQVLTGHVILSSKDSPSLSIISAAHPLVCSRFTLSLDSRCLECG